MHDRVFAQQQIKTNAFAGDALADAVLNAHNTVPVRREVANWVGATAALAILTLYGNGIEPPRKS